MITNFPALAAHNSGGYSSFKFIPSIYITAFPSATNHIISAAVTTLSAWLDGYATYETLKFEEETIKSSHGESYRPEISGFIPGESAELTQLLFEMEQIKKFVVQITNNRGKIRIVGSPGMPLEFASDFNSGSERISSKGFTFKFAGDSLNRAPFYQL